MARGIDPETALALREADKADEVKRQAAKIRVALEQARHDAEHARFPLTKAAKADFLRLVAAGMPVFDIAVLLKVSRGTFYNHRNVDPDFAQAWERALEMRYTPIEDRLADIAVSGAPEAMATVRAAEVLLKGSIRRYNQAPASTQVSAKMTKHSDGSASFETRLGAFSD